MGKHSNIIGGSSLYRRAHCLGSMREEERVNAPDLGNAYADEGTMLHNVMEACVVHDTAPEDVTDLAKFNYNDAELNADNVKLAQSAWQMYEELRESVEGFVKATEVKVSLEAIAPGLFGTADLPWFGKRNGKWTLGVLDWKFGAGVVVPAKGSMQLGFYMLGLMLDPDFKEYADRAEQFELSICQPARNDFLDTWVTTREWLDMLRDIIEVTYHAIQDPKAPLKVGDWCRWCSANLSCSELTRVGMSALSLPTERMTAVELAYWLPKLDVLTAFVNRVKQVAYDEIDAGAAVAGFKIVEKSARRSHTDPDVSEQWLRKRARMLVREIKKTELLSPAQVDKALKKKYGKDAKALIDTFNAECVTKATTGTTLVSDTDPRPAVNGLGETLARALEGVDLDLE